MFKLLAVPVGAQPRVTGAQNDSLNSVTHAPRLSDLVASESKPSTRRNAPSETPTANDHAALCMNIRGSNSLTSADE